MFAIQPRLQPPSLLGSVWLMSNQQPLCQTMWPVGFESNVYQWKSSLFGGGMWRNFKAFRVWLGIPKSCIVLKNTWEDILLIIIKISNLILLWFKNIFCWMLFFNNLFLLFSIETKQSKSNETKFVFKQLFSLQTAKKKENNTKLRLVFCGRLLFYSEPIPAKQKSEKIETVLHLVRGGNSKQKWRKQSPNHECETPWPRVTDESAKNLSPRGK